MMDWIGQFEFSHPLRLYALLLIPVVVYTGIASTTELQKWRRAVSSAVRSVLMSLLIVAWAGLAQRGPTDELFSVVLTDVSASAGSNDDNTVIANASSSGTANVRRLSFAGDISNSESVPKTNALTIDPQVSDPGAAVLYAMAAAPAMYVPRIVLNTDGLETAGHLFEAAQNGIPIYVQPTEAFENDEVCVMSVEAEPPPPSAANRLRVAIASNHVDRGVVQLFVANAEGGSSEWRLVDTRTVDLTAGDNMIEFDVPTLDAAAIGRIVLKDFKDRYSENNAASVLLTRPAERRALLVADRDGGGTVSTMLQSAGFDVQSVSPQDVSGLAAELAIVELAVMANVSPTDLGPRGVSTIVRFVRGGGGLIVLGDGKTFGYETLRNSEFEKLLPVRATQEVADNRSTVAMLLVIDKSRSMKFNDRNEDRMELAIQAAKRVVDLDQLTPLDQIGILAFGSESEWISSIVPCTDKPQLKRKINGIEVAGQTNMYPALQRAYLALTEAAADRRHVILMTDGVPSPGEFDAISRQMADAGITVSTVSISAGADQLILKDISRLAGGRHIHCESADELASKLVQEARRTVDQKRDQFEVAAYRQLPGLSIDEAPPLAGYALTSPKPDSELLLLAGPGDPLLAWRHMGMGKVIAFTSTIGGKWAEDWDSWKGAAGFWARINQFAQRRPLPSDFQLTFNCRRGQCVVTFDVVGQDGGLLNFADVQFSVRRVALDDSGTAAMQEYFQGTLQQSAPGRYAAEFAADDLGAYLVDVTWSDESDQGRNASTSVFVNYPDEYRLESADEDLLQDVAAVSKGLFGPTADESAATDNRTVERYYPWWRCLIFIGMFLFVIDVAVRRA